MIGNEVPFSHTKISDSRYEHLWLFVFVVASILVLFNLIPKATFGQDAVPSDELVDEEIVALMTSIDVAVKQWRDEISFMGTFVYRQGTAESLEDATLGNFINPVNGAKIRGDRANGIVAKLGNAFRMSFIVEGDSNYDSESQIVSWNSFDIATANDVEIYIVPKQAGIKGAGLSGFVKFQDISVREPDTLFREIEMLRFCPFVFCGGNEGAIFKPKLDSAKYRFSVHSTSESTVKISVRSRKTGVENVYSMKTDCRFPVLESITRAGENLRIASDFVDCRNGCMLPRRLVTASGPHKSIDGKAIWIGRVWESQDIGNQQPGQNDFLITIPPDLKVSGLNAAGPLENVNILRMNANDLSLSPASSAPYRELDEMFGTFGKNEIQHKKSTNWSNLPWYSMVAIVIGGFFWFLSTRLNSHRPVRNP